MVDKIKIAVIFPSRGLCFSKTAQEVLDNLEGHDYDIFFAHGLPIPDCFEKPLQEAMRVNEDTCADCIKGGCALCASGNNTKIEAWNAKRRAARNRNLSSRVNSEDPLPKDSAKNTSLKESEILDTQNTETAESTKMGMSSSGSAGREDSSQSTESSWSKNSDANSENSNRSTTSTENERIIGPKIYNSGLVESDTARERQKSSAHIVKSHICNNHEALRGSYSHIWFVEDDMILPEGTLDTMLALDAPVVACDYPVSKSGQGAIFKTGEGKILFAGTGCLLVRRDVFKKLKPPYFRTDIRWGAINYGSFIRMTASQITNPTLEGYGLHDTNFGIKLWRAGIPISESGQIGQRKLVRLGQAGSNHGTHEIEEWTTVKPNVLYRKFKRMPVQPLGKLVPVLTHEGELMVRPDHAKKLIKAGIAVKPIQQSIAIDYNGYDL